MKNKLKAFTLIDVLGAMLISSIIVCAALYFLIFVQENQNEFEDSSERKYKVELAYEKLNHLFLKTDDIIQKGSEVVFLQNNRKSTVDFVETILAERQETNAA